MNDLEKGWIAGIIDGEGSVSMDKNGTWRRPIVSVISTDKEIIDELTRISKGYVYERTDNRGYKTCWIWKKIGGYKVIELLKDISPLLRCPKKANRAKYLIQKYPNHTMRNGYYTENQKEAKKLFEQKFYEL